MSVRKNKKTTCSALFSEMIRKTMKEMGAEKTRPQVIAISAKRTIHDYPGCKRFLERKQERIDLDATHWIVWSSKSFRLHRSKPCSIRVFFRKKAKAKALPTSTTSTIAWKPRLQQILQERLGVRNSNVRLGKESGGGGGDNYIEIVITDPTLILSLLNHRVAGFLD